MFAQCGWWPVYRGPIYETHRASDQLYRSELRMIHRDHSISRNHMRMLEYLGDGKKGSAWNAMLFQNRLPLGG